MATNRMTESNISENEYENFFNIKPSTTQRKEDELLSLRKKLKEEMKKRNQTEKEQYKLKTRLKTLKMEEDKAWKKVETTKKVITTIENVRKNILSNKIQQEEFKNKKEKEFEDKRQAIINKQNQTKEFLKNWKANLAIKNHEEKLKLKTEKKKIERKVNIEKQEDEEKNKQLCIKVKSAKMNYLDNKLKNIQNKKNMLKKEILGRIQQEITTQTEINKEVSKIKEEEIEIKANLETLENSRLDDGKLLFLLF